MQKVSSSVIGITLGIVGFLSILGQGCTKYEHPQPTKPQERDDHRPEFAQLSQRDKIKNEILRDVRVWRELPSHLSQGRPMPSVTASRDGGYYCTKTGEKLWVYVISDLVTRVAEDVEEIAFYCPLHKHYEYHYKNKSKNTSVWLGPFELEE